MLLSIQSCRMHMIVKLGYIFTIVLFSFTHLYAQNSQTIRGIILDSISRKPVAYATVNLTGTVSSSVKSTYTKDDGSFTFEKITPGKYTVTVGAMTYTVKTIIIDLSASTKLTADLAHILLSAQHTNLKEVVIKGAKPLVIQEIDRLSYDVQADPEGNSQNMLDIIHKVPLLSVEGEDNIRLKGSSDFKIFINGKPSNMMTQNPALALRMMRASNVQKIEVITTPSAKYDSEGLAGIINIITKNLTTGYNLIIEAFDNSRIYEGIGSAFMIKNGKLGFNGYVGKYGKNFGRNLFFNTLTPISWTQPNIEQNGDNQISGPYTPGNIDASYEIDSLNLLTGSFAFTIDRIRQDGGQLSSEYDINHQFLRSFQITNLSTTKKNTLDFGINYQHGFKNNRERMLTFSYTYSKAISNYEGDNITDPGLNNNHVELTQQNQNGFNEHTAQLDYISPIKKISIETGVKLITRNNYSNMSLENYSFTDPILTHSSFDYQQNVYGGYNSYQLKLKSWGFKAGMRLEMTTINATQMAKNYLNLIPSIAIQYKLNNLNSLNFGFTQRIQRPAILQLNPFENQSNPLFFVSGNPNLVPVVSNNFDLNYTRIKKVTVNASLNYSSADNTIQNFVMQGPDGITRSTFANIGHYDNTGVNLNINWPIVPKLSIILNGRVQYLWLQALVNNQGYKNQGLSGTVSSNLSYKIKNDWIYSIRFSAYSNQVNLQGQTNGYYTLYTRISKEFFNKKLGLIASVNNLLERYRTIINDYNTPTTTQRYTAKNDIRSLYINVYYTFGKLKEKLKKNKRGINNDDIDMGKTEQN